MAKRDLKAMPEGRRTLIGSVIWLTLFLTAVMVISFAGTAGTPLGRIGQPDDIASVAVFLASDDSAWLTGERLTASGGLR